MQRISHSSISLGSLLFFALIACGKAGDKATGDASATADLPSDGGAVGAGVVAKAQIGGQLVAVGKRTVELRLFKNGAAEAVVDDESGAALADQSKAKVVVHATAGDAHPNIELGFAAPTARLSAPATANAELTASPMDVDLTLGNVTTTGHLEAPVLLVGPEIGGTLAVAGKYGVELLARADGTVQAVVHDAAGARVAGDAALKLEVKLAGADGQAHAIALAFDPASLRFVGKADAGLALAAGPADISVNGTLGVHLPELALRAEATHGGHVVVVGDFSVELVAKGNAVSAFVFDASGAASAKADLELAVRVGSGAFVTLAWDAPSASYRAKLDAKLNLDAEPIAVSLKAGANAFVGATLPSVKVDASGGAKAKLDVKANLDVNPKAKFEAKANVKAPTAAANVAVQAPKVSVGTGAGAKAGASAGASFSFGTH